MDSSQSSDLYNESIFTNEDVDNNQEPYQNHLICVKKFLKSNVKVECSKPSFCNFFTELIENCYSCIKCGLNLSKSLCENDSSLPKVCSILEEITWLLDSFAKYLKEVLNIVTINCSTVGMLPISTGNILVAIFTHCRDSEIIYGSVLNSVQNELKCLFRKCHELQLLYLTVLEKHFVFNLVNGEDLDVLVEAININLKIGEIVQNLDLKTMAEQWKSLTSLCERYSNYLLDKDVFQDCIMCLCKMVQDNITKALEEDDEKLIQRSLKVASFNIKLVTKSCLIFKQSLDKNMDCIVEMMIFIQIQNVAFLTPKRKSSQFIQMMNTNVLMPVEYVVSELQNDVVFIQSILLYDTSKIPHEEVAGYVLFLISLMRSLSVKNDRKEIENWFKSDCNIFTTVMQVLDRCHVCFTQDLKFNLNKSRTSGLYEYLLISTANLAIRCDANQYCVLEVQMIDSVLNTSVYRAMFATDLWILLARVSPPQLTTTQLLFISNLYKTLQSNNINTSPQAIHLKHLIKGLFEVLAKEEKKIIYNQIDINNNDNISIWCAMNIKKLPDNIRRVAEENALEKLRIQVNKLMNNSMRTIEDVYLTINIIKMASTCSFISDNIEKEIINIWTKLCKVQITKDMYPPSWYIEYINAAQMITLPLLRYFQRNSSSIIKVLHVISNLIADSSLEVKLILLNIIIKLTICDIDKNKEIIQKLSRKIFDVLLREDNVIFKTKLYVQLKDMMMYQAIEELVNEAVNEGILDDWEYFLLNGKLINSNKLPLVEQLKYSSEIQYEHKCAHSTGAVNLLERKCSSNFDMELDGLFDNDNELSPPANKKAKLDSVDVDVVLSRIKNDVLTLVEVKSDISATSRFRIQSIVENLKDLI